jgi:O-antigen/teichoic acid export membrane protein
VSNIPVESEIDQGTNDGSFARKSKKQLLFGLFSNASLYGIAVILPRFGDLVMIPIYWSRLEPSDFGIIALAQMLILFLGPLLSLGLYDSLQRLYYEWKAEQRAQHVTALWVCSIAVSLALCMTFDLLGRGLSSYVLTQIPFDPYIRITIWSAFLVNFTLIPYALFRVREQMKKFIVVSATTFLFQTACTVYFVLVLNKGAVGYLLGGLIGNGVVAIYLIWVMVRESRFPIKFGYLGESLRYSVPLIPAMIIESVGSVFDRFFLDKYVGLSSIGFYNLGRQFGSAFNMFNIAMKYSWFPLIYRVTAERNDAPDVLAKLSLYYVALLAIPALAIALLSQELIMWFGGSRYEGVYEFVPAFIIMFFANSVGMAMGRGIDLVKKTIYNSLLAPVVLVVNFVSMWLLIPVYGVWGAVIGGLITIWSRHLIAIVAGFLLYPRPLPARKLITLVLICVTAFYIGSHIHAQSLITSFLVKCTIIVFASLGIAFFCLDGRRALRTLKGLRYRRAA